MSYVPELNDYITWRRGVEGWVYFKCDEYITIETSVWKRILRIMNVAQFIEMIVS